MYKERLEATGLSWPSLLLEAVWACSLLVFSYCKGMYPFLLEEKNKKKDGSFPPFAGCGLVFSQTVSQLDIMLAGELITRIERDTLSLRGNCA